MRSVRRRSKRASRSHPNSYWKPFVQTHATEVASSSRSRKTCFIYGAAAPFYIPNPNALVNFYETIANVPGIDYLPLSHATIAPAVVNPDLVKELSKILLPKSALRNRFSSHPDKKFLAPLIGIETGSPRLSALTMSGKSLPFRHP